MLSFAFIVTSTPVQDNKVHYGDHFDAYGNDFRHNYSHALSALDQEKTKNNCDSRLMIWMFHENCFILCKYEKQKSIAAAFRSCTDLGNFDIEEMCLGTIFGDDYFWL